MFTLSVQTGAKYLLMVISGDVGLAELCAAHDFMCEMGRRTACGRLLVDMLGLSVRIEAGQRDAALAHLRTGPLWQRLAVVVHPQVTHGLVMHVALERGVPVQEFGSLEAAEAWLVADEVAASPQPAATNPGRR